MRRISVFILLSVLSVSHPSAGFAQKGEKFLLPRWLIVKPKTVVVTHDNEANTGGLKDRLKRLFSFSKGESGRKGGENKTLFWSPSVFNPVPDPAKDESKQGFAVDLLTFSDSGSWEFVPVDTVRSSWFNALIDALSKPYPLPPDKGGQGAEGRALWSDTASKTYYDYLKENGKAPQPCSSIDQMWKPEQGCVAKKDIFTVFNGLGADGSVSAQRQKDADGGVIGMTFDPSKGFRSGYRILVTTDPTSGKRFFHFEPTQDAVYRFSNGIAWVRHVFGECTPGEGTPKDDNKWLLQWGDIAGFSAMLFPGASQWSDDYAKNYFNYRGGFLSTPRTNTCGAYWFLDVPVTEGPLLSPSGTHEGFKESEAERVKTLTITQTTRADVQGDQGMVMRVQEGSVRQAGDRDGALPPSCPAGGIPPTDEVESRIHALAITRVPDDIVQEPVGKIINYTWLNPTSAGVLTSMGWYDSVTSREHRYDIDGDSYPEGEDYADISAYDVSVVSALKALRSRLAYTFRSDKVSPASANVQSQDSNGVKPSDWSDQVLWMLYHLDIGIDGLKTGRVALNFAAPGVTLPGNALSLFDPSRRAIILSDKLSSALLGTKKTLLKSRIPEGQDVQVLSNFGAVAGPLLDALLHYAVFASDLTMVAHPVSGDLGNYQAIALSTAPASPLIPPVNAPITPQDKGIFFDVSGKFCQYPSGKINPVTCVRSMESCAKTDKILFGEDMISLTTAILTGPVSDELEGIRKETLCGLEDFIVGCEQPGAFDDLNYVANSDDPAGLKQHKFCECRAGHGTTILKFHLPQDACSWAHASRQSDHQPIECASRDLSQELSCDVNFMNDTTALACWYDSGNPGQTKDNPGTCENPFCRGDNPYVYNSSLPFPGFSMRGTQAFGTGGLFGESPLSSADFVPSGFQLLNLVKGGMGDEALRLVSLLRDRSSLIPQEPVKSIPEAANRMEGAK